MAKKILIDAFKYHRLNDISEAEKLYSQYLKKAPNDYQALFGLGTLYLQTNKFHESIVFLKKACEFNLKDSHLLMNLGIAYRELNKFQSSEEFLKKAIELDANNPDIYNHLSILYKKIGKFDEALRFIDKALQIQKNDAYSINRADYLFELGQHNDAISDLKKIGSASSYYVSAQKKLFNFYFQRKSFDNCIVTGKYLIELEPSNTKILLQTIDAAIEINKIGMAALLLQQLPKDDNDYIFYQAKIYQESGKVNEAIYTYEQLIKKGYSKQACYHNLACIFFRNNNFTKAIEYFKHSIKIKPDFLESKLQLGLCQLATFDFKNGWANFLSYACSPVYINKLSKQLPKWNGLNSSTEVLIYLDQGIGDQIFFSQLLTRLKNFKNTFSVAMDQRLLRIYEESFSQFNFNFICHSKIKENGPFQAFCLGTDLALLFIKNKEDILSCKSFLKVSAIKNTAGPIKDKSIGLSWFSNNIRIGPKKSIALEQLMEVLHKKSTQFVNLQYGDFADEILAITKKYNVHFCEVVAGDNLNDLYNLAQKIMQCNEIFTISNTTAHLAGALGVKVNLLLPFNHASNTWYWLSEDDFSLFYPSIKIIQAKKNKPIEDTLKQI